MNQIADVWFIRLPTGRVLRAHSTNAVRRHLNRGRIPSNSQGRRSSEEDWRRLEVIAEFADLVLRPAGNGHPTTSDVPDSIASRLDSPALKTIGLAGMLQELLGALGSTLVRSKLLVGAAAGLGVGAVLAVLASGVLDGLLPNLWVRWAIVAVALLGVAAPVSALLTKVTYLELCNLRPARWPEARAGLAINSIRLVFLYLVTAGVALGAIGVLRYLPSWMLDVRNWPWSDETRPHAAAVAAVLAVVLEVALWMLAGLSLILGPVTVVEECSVAAALVQWCRLLQRHFARLFLYEVLAAAAGIAVSLALALPLVLPVLTTGRFTHAAGLALWVLGGLAATPLIVFLAVANVFIYLDVRYRSKARH
jgi:hypothetical protein